MKNQTRTLYLIAIVMLTSQILINPSLSNSHRIAQPQLVLIIQTDRPSYQQGEAVEIFGAVMDSGSQPIGNATISLEIKDPSNSTIFLDIVFSSSNGTYTDNLRLHNDTALGKYHVCATASAVGYPPATNQTSFIVGATENHDIAVTNVTLSKNIVGQRYATSINAEIENQGNSIESFNATAYYNETPITLPDGKNHTTITLASGNSTTFTFTWNTTGVDKGNYTIGVCAIPIPGEIDTIDNTFVDGWVFVSIPGDVDGDRDVDIYDVVKITSIYLSEIGDPNYKANSDVDSNGVITIYDVVICTSHYRQSW